MIKQIFQSKVFLVLISYYILLVLWWVKIFISGVKEGDENMLFGFAYSLIPLLGGIYGIIIAKKWGGFKSHIGKGIIYLSLGLFGYWLGQTIWSYYNLVAKVEIPYPSVADFGYFSAIITYSLGMYHFARAAGSKYFLKKNNARFVAIMIPAIMLSVSYFFFVKDAPHDFSNPVKTFLDYGTPLGLAIPISIAIATYSLSRKMLGGIMRPKILFIVVALVMEYITEFTFFYQAATGSYYNAGINDLMFTTSFTLMAVGLMLFKNYE